MSKHTVQVIIAAGITITVVVAAYKGEWNVVSAGLTGAFALLHIPTSQNNDGVGNG
ncbi:MAG: hypothetical protein WA003_15790 [Desulfuromonadaceae bacterium]